jgi:lysophospholipase L1-like esterase
MLQHLLVSLTVAAIIFPQQAALAQAKSPPATPHTPREIVEKSQRILFLGDSITYAGSYVAALDAWLLSRAHGKPPVVINGGLPSETLSGLSEAGHADGQFPRPHLAERLDRILNLAKPDLVVACYGINCGIYEPFEEARLLSYQQGYQELQAKVKKAGAQFIAITPPFYDDQRSPRPFSYNEVLDRYSEWLLGQRAHGWTVIDLHAPMTAEVKKRRREDAQFTFQPDGVHPNEAGHWYMAQQLITALGDARAKQWADPSAMARELSLPVEVLPLVQQRMSVRRDAYLAKAGHKRPGIRAGLPWDAAQVSDAELSEQIAAALRK